MYSLILVNYNSWEDICKIIDSLLPNTSIKYFIVIDNSPKSTEFISLDAYNNRVIYVSALDNLGYSGGNNLGVYTLKTLNFTGHVVISNNDVRIDENFTDSVESIFKKDLTIGQVAFKTFDESHKPLYSNIKLNGLVQKWSTDSSGNYFKKNGVRITFEYGDYAAGSFFIIRDFVFAKLPFFFDEHYFMYWEEVDLSIRIRNMSYKVVYLQTPILYRSSNNSTSITKSIYYLTRNAFYFKEKHSYSNFELLRYIFIMAKRSIFLSLKFKQLRPCKNFILGVLDGFSGEVSGSKTDL